MPLLNEILQHNKQFVERKEYEQLRTDRFPTRKLVVLTCMDTRLIELLPRAMNIRQGDAKILKTAGAIISHPFGGIMRSILVALYELGAREVCVVGHYGCGMTGLSCKSILDKAKTRGVSEQTIERIRESGVNLESWLVGFKDVHEGVLRSVELIRQHPLLPNDVAVHGLLIDPETGKLDVVFDGYASRETA